MQAFYIKFSDNFKVLFDDVIVLNSIQKGKIVSTARKYKREEITNAKTGLKVSLTSNQKDEIVVAKERIVSDKSPLDLHEKQIVEFTEHSIDRIIKRYKGNLTECYLVMIDMVKKSKEINELAEWKGYSSLAYTFLHTANLNLDKIVVAFVRNGDHIRIVTVMNDVEVDSMDYRLSEDDDTAQMLLRFRSQLKDGYNS